MRAVAPPDWRRMRHVGIIWLATQPASGNAGLADGFRTQQCMVDATEAHAHYQNHRQRKPRREVGHVLCAFSGTRQPPAPSTTTTSACACNARQASHYFIQLYRHARLGSSDVGCNGGSKRYGFTSAGSASTLDAASQLFYIVPIRHAVTPVATGRHRLHAHRCRPARQRHAAAPPIQRLAHAGIGAGHEKLDQKTTPGHDRPFSVRRRWMFIWMM